MKGTAEALRIIICASNLFSIKGDERGEKMPFALELGAGV